MGICGRNCDLGLEIKAQDKELTCFLKRGKGQTRIPGWSNFFDYKKLVVLFKWFLIISCPISFRVERPYVEAKINFYLIFMVNINFSMCNISKRSRLEPKTKSWMKMCGILLL